VKDYRTIAILAATAGCAGTTQPAPHVVFDGVYRAEGEGEIAAIAFANGQDYGLVGASCAEATCIEVGKYAYEEARRSPSPRPDRRPEDVPGRRPVDRAVRGEWHVEAESGARW
jgi:hypothetical protein